GLSLRMLSAGNRVFFGQFMKGRDCSELRASSLFENFRIEQFGNAEFIKGNPSRDDISRAEKGLLRMKEVLDSGLYDMVVFDEVNRAVHIGLLAAGEVLRVVDGKPDATEVILTGRSAPQEIIDRADLVTEMKEIKHYYNAGVMSRVGIED
ncbi:MAG: cob(I)yrinic acid a,c-diamide adenosyltransferase, partial [Clostridiales Family XIII bacterium]|nr:cob(I)yrinic acid a,c-diamide adenosyltransferase [Clostridiales Family XIII bacterium]